MTLVDKIKTNDQRLKQIKLSMIQTAKISALSSDKLQKYDYLTGEDLAPKSALTEQGKFEYSPLGKIFNKVLEEKTKEDGLFKGLGNVEGKNEEQLKPINYQGEKQLTIKGKAN